MTVFIEHEQGTGFIPIKEKRVGISVFVLCVCDIMEIPKVVTRNIYLELLFYCYFSMESLYVAYASPRPLLKGSSHLRFPRI